MERGRKRGRHLQTSPFGTLLDIHASKGVLGDFRLRKPFGEDPRSTVEHMQSRQQGTLYALNPCSHRGNHRQRERGWKKHKERPTRVVVVGMERMNRRSSDMQQRRPKRCKAEERRGWDTREWPGKRNNGVRCCWPYEKKHLDKEHRQIRDGCDDDNHVH